jgi:predicted nucleotidyltransferase
MRTAAPALLPLFRSEMQVEMLALLLLQPDRSWTLEGLAERVRAPQSSVHRELGRAVDAGVATRDQSRRPHLFRAATDSPIYEPLKELLERTAGVRVRLARALDAVAGVRAAAIHGSWAEGRVRPDSDVDVIVVWDGDGDDLAVSRAVRSVGRTIGRDVDVSVVASDDFARLADERNPFVERLLRGPRIDVVGDIAALRAGA